MDNRHVVIQFFDFLRRMIMSLCQNQNDDAEMKELEYLANYVKDMVADSLQERETGNIPILSLTVYGSRDGKTTARFAIPRNIGIIESWSLKKLAVNLDKVISEWDSRHLENQDKAPNDDC